MSAQDIFGSSLRGLPTDAASMDVATVHDLAAVPDMPWLDAALCGDLPLDQLDLFFVEAGRTIVSSTIALCRRCPSRRACLDHAYRNELTSGFFGGISPSRRRALTHEQALAELSGEATSQRS
jgi:WhiB family transcriptional regulator, redox-sensing transcriptional regulator